MFNFKSNKMNKLPLGVELLPNVTPIYVTKNYNLFKILDGNRGVKNSHVARLVHSFGLNYLISPITVNENWEIIDGQHRFEAAKKLELEIYFFIVQGYNLNEVQTLNQNASNWNKNDFVESYSKLGVSEFLELKKFMEHYPDFSTTNAEAILTLRSGGMNNAGAIKGTIGVNGVFGSHGVKKKNFQDGELVIPDIAMSYDFANKIMEIKEYYDGYNRSVFVNAMIGILKNPNYVHKEFIKKLSLSRTLLFHCGTVSAYRLLIEEIYNRNRREKVVIRF